MTGRGGAAASAPRPSPLRRRGSAARLRDDGRASRSASRLQRPPLSPIRPPWSLPSSATHIHHQLSLVVDRETGSGHHESLTLTTPMRRRTGAPRQASSSTCKPPAGAHKIAQAPIPVGVIGRNAESSSLHLRLMESFHRRTRSKVATAAHPSSAAVANATSCGRFRFLLESGSATRVSRDSCGCSHAAVAPTRESVFTDCSCRLLRVATCS
jgi:hypothetical protein